MKDLSGFIKENDLDFIATTLQMMPNFESFDELIITSIQILRASSLDNYNERSFLLLEGSDDCKFWTYYISDENCRIIICNGKKHIVAAIEKISKEKIAGVLGIVDDDFDSLEGKSLNLPNLIATETHDLECLLLRSQAFGKVLAECGDKKKIEQFKQIENKELREALLKRGEIFGRLRWLSCKYDWEINFKHKGLQPKLFIDQNWNICNQNNLFHEIISQMKSTLTHEEFNSLLNSLPQNVDLWKVCQGHDLVWFLAEALKIVWGKKQVSEESVAATLRQGIDSTEFLATELATKVKIWECDNQPYQIFRAYN